MGNAMQWGKCHEGEICIEGDPREAGLYQNWEWVQETAWCVEIMNFIRILSRSEGRSGPFMGEVDVRDEGDDVSRYLVEALLTTRDSKSLSHAQSMEVLAEKDDGGGKWQTLSNGGSKCFGCSTMKIDSVPDETERIVANVGLMPGISEGLLYLASVG